MTLARTNTMQADKLGSEMREDSTPALSRRPKSIGFCLASIASLGVITLYQTGILRHLPDPPLPGFNAEKVYGSAQAFSHIGLIDAALAIARGVPVALQGLA